jgi:hypothetical protein
MTFVDCPLRINIVVVRLTLFFIISIWIPLSWLPGATLFPFVFIRDLFPRHVSQGVASVGATAAVVDRGVGLVDTSQGRRRLSEYEIWFRDGSSVITPHRTKLGHPCAVTKNQILLYCSVP